MEEAGDAQAWLHLHVRWDPQSNGRCNAMMGTLLNTVLEGELTRALEVWGLNVLEYEQMMSRQIDDSVKVGIVSGGLDLRRNWPLNAGRHTTYTSL